MRHKISLCTCMHLPWSTNGRPGQRSPLNLAAALCQRFVYIPTFVIRKYQPLPLGSLGVVMANSTVCAYWRYRRLTRAPKGAIGPKGLKRFEAVQIAFTRNYLNRFPCKRIAVCKTIYVTTMLCSNWNTEARNGTKKPRIEEKAPQSDRRSDQVRVLTCKIVVFS